MSHSGSLVLLTRSFPYAGAAEPFLEAEIEVLAERFARVYLVPSQRDGEPRPLPQNVHLVELPWLDGFSRRARWRALVSGTAMATWLRTVFAPGNLGPYLRSPRSYLDLLAQGVLQLRVLRRFIRERALQDAVFYDYWFENATLALALLRRREEVSCAVSRAHGFDVYDERWPAGRVPFREVKATSLDAIFVVSAFGADYMQRRVPALGHKVQVARLGVRPQPETGPESDGVPVVLTCGSLLPFKRVHLVPDVLRSHEGPARWVHIGDGPDRARVEEAAASLPERIQWSITGTMPNAEVLEFYRLNPVRLLISMSLTEGLPVSMMEALSFGVPVLAAGVQGVPEIVRPETGVLLPEDASTGDFAAGLREALEPDRFDRGIIRAFFEENFLAAANYNAFADALIALHEDQAPAA
jgi:glycosyltransferase involved in cell wall biosynthesis